MRLIPANPRFAKAIDPTLCQGYFAEGFGEMANGVDWEKSRVSKAFPHKKGGFALQYEVPLFSGEIFHIGGHLVAKPDIKPDWAGAKPGTLWVAELGLALATPASDPILGSVFNTPNGQSGKELAEGLGWLENQVDLTSILAYRLAKRCVVLLENSNDGRRAVVKFSRPRSVQAMAKAARLVAASGLPVPPLLWKSPSDRFVAMGFVQGQGLENITGAKCIEGHRAAGVLLRQLHGSRPSEKGVRTARDELNQLGHWVPVVATLFPELAEETGACLAALESHIPDPLPQLSTIHRDFYDKQVMVHESQVVLLDFDTLTQGDPNLDLGNFLAHVRLRGQQYPAQRETLATAGEKFLSGYGGLPLELGGLAWWQAAALLRLVVVYSLRPSWQHLVSNLLEEVHLCLHAPECPL